jgi:putative tricarboxylic transport membrane protein
VNHKDSIAGVMLLALAGGYYWLALAIPSSSLSDEVGADGLPRLLAISLAVVACLILAKGLMAKRQAAPAAGAVDEAADHAALPRALGFIAIGAGYMVIAPLIGFAAGVAVLVVAVAVYEREPISPKLLAVAVAGGLGFWLAFVWFLGTEQPVSSLLAMLLKG